MRIEFLKQEQKEDYSSISASITWEDSKNENREIYFKVPAKFASYLNNSYDPFLTGCVVPAMFAGEKRIYIDGEIDPQLLEGIKLNLSILKHWYDSPAIPDIQCCIRSDYVLNIRN